MITTNIRHCARCGFDHDNLEFQELTRPPEDGMWTHWAPCPLNGEPIMLSVIKERKFVHRTAVGAWMFFGKGPQDSIEPPKE